MLSETPGTQAPKLYSSERGQMILWAPLILTVVFIIGAIAVDFGVWLSERRRAQTAADFAALSAATELRNSDAATVTKGLDYAERNGYDNDEPDVQVFVTPQYGGDPDEVEVKVEENSPMLFLDIFGLVDTDIGARAVAELTDTTGTGTEYAIFANQDNTCGSPEPLEISGSTNIAVGAIHSNSDLKINGSDNDFDQGPVTHGQGCSTNLSGSNNSFQQNFPADGGLQPMPIDYEYSDFPCDYTIQLNQSSSLSSHPQVWADFNTKELKSWVICSLHDLVLSDQFSHGTVTLVAMDELDISGSDFDIIGLWNDVLAFSAATHDNAIEMSGSNGDWTGFIHAPDGKVTINGGTNLSVHGSIIADRVKISGSNFSIDATGFPVVIPQPPIIALIE